jgi:hypothetical protein
MFDQTPIPQALMILKFPDLNTLRIALTTGAVPGAVSQTAVVAGFDDQDQLWVDTSASFPRAAQTELRRLGVQLPKSSGARSMAEFTCWAQLLPLVPDNGPVERLEQTPVLFELPSGDKLAALATEILRLGNDRQGYRWLEPTDPKDPNATARALLRVVGPPYYSLLRALDRQGKASAPLAFIERAPRVWVEFGWSHPLVEQIKPPDGKLLVLRPPRQWSLLDDVPYRDIYEVMEFTLPATAAALKDGDLKAKLEVKPSLKVGGSTEGAELWVLRQDAVRELNQFVQNSDDQLLHRLSFAVGERKGEKIIIIRVRQSKLPPPVLVLKAEAYRHYLKLPNLFLPVGTRLHPPLRRDKVRQLFAEDTNEVVWLAPDSSKSGGFTPESLPEEAFRPLWDWIDYVLDHEKEALQMWVQAAQFDFEPFICDEEQLERIRKQPPPDKEKPTRGRKGKDVSLPSGDVQGFTRPDEAQAEEVEGEAEEVLEVLPAEPSELQKQREALEEQFLAIEGGLDVPERIALWPQLAQVNAALTGGIDEAGLCWANALWFEDPASLDKAWHWFHTEARNVPTETEGRQKGRAWTSKVTATGRNAEVSGDDLDLLLRKNEPSVADVRALAAYIVWSARRATPPKSLIERLNPVQRFLEKHERLIPVRFTWLAWAHLARMSKGDVLALARARDRLLERLYHGGLRPEQDLPFFLKGKNQGGQRFRAVRQWMTHLADLARAWVQQPDNVTDPKVPMPAYIDLFFGFGLARLGETDASRSLIEQAREALEHKGEVHTYLFQAFEYRTKQALEGKPHSGPLPQEQVEYLEHMEKMPRYVVDRMRQQSRILEPNQKIDPYRHWGARISDLDKALAELVDITDRKEIVNRVQALLKDVPRGKKGDENRARILRAALNLAPRVSEEFARDMLDRVLPAYDALPDPPGHPELLELAEFLEKAMSVAGHFDRIEHVHPLVKRFQGLLQTQKGDKAIQAVESLAGQCFKSLRKLGMRDEIDQIQTQMAHAVLGGQDVKDVDPDKLSPAALRALLHVAASWYYFNRDRQAEPVIQMVRSVLFKRDLPPRDRTQLACTYAAAVGQGPVELAQKRLEELFEKLKAIKDTYTTNQFYSLSQLNVLEAVVLAVVSDDFTLGTQARRWLDDDEYLVRQRVHRDLRKLEKEHG